MNEILKIFEVYQFKFLTHSYRIYFQWLDDRNQILILKNQHFRNEIF